MQSLKSAIETEFNCTASGAQRRKITCEEDYWKVMEESKAHQAKIKKQAKKVVRDEVKVEVFNKAGMSHDEILAARQKVYEAERVRLKALPYETLLDVQRAFVRRGSLQDKMDSTWYEEELSKAAGLGTLFYEPTAEDKREAERDKRCSLYKNSEIDKRFWDVKNDDVIANKISEGVNTSQIVYLHGNAGVGKTYSSTVFLKKMIDEKGLHEPCRCKLTNFTEILNLIHASQSFTYQGEDPIYKMSLYNYLVVDDLGLEKPDQNMLDALFYLISKRQEHSLPTVLISNFNREEVISRLSSGTNNKETIKAVRSRLFGDCCCIEYVGEDRRKAA